MTFEIDDQRHRGERGNHDSDWRELLHAFAPNRPLGRTSSTAMKIRKMPIWPSDSPRNRPGQAFHHADDQAADQRARHRAHAAEHDNGEGDEDKSVTRARIDVISRHQQAGGNGNTSGAEAEGHGVDMRDLNANQFRAELLLGDSADRLADVGPAHDQPEQQRDGKGRREADDARHSEKGEAEVDRLERVRHVDGAGIGAKGVEQRVLDHDGDAERHQQHVAIVAVRGRTDDETLQRVAKDEERRRQQEGGNIGVEPERMKGEEDREHGGTQQRAVREIDDVQHAVDQRQPERDKRIDRAGQQAVEDRGNQDDGRKHGLDTLEDAARGRRRGAARACRRQTGGNG